MTITLHAYCGFPNYTAAGIDFRGQDHHALKFIKVIKGRGVNGYGRARLADGGSQKFVSGDHAILVDIFARWAAKRIREIGAGPALLVPVPSSSHTNFNDDFIPKRLADRIAVALGGNGFTVAPVLAFIKPMSKDSEANKTNVARHSEGELYENLKASQRALVGDVILVDDMCSAGRHFRSAAKKLREMGATVHQAFSPGRTVHSPLDDMFNVPLEDIEAAC